jgi:hypothetical protein
MAEGATIRKLLLMSRHTNIPGWADVPGWKGLAVVKRQATVTDLPMAGEHRGQMVRHFDDESAREGYCLYEVIRNLVLGSQIVQDHVIHFYHLHALDFVNVVNAAKADPMKAAAAARAIEPGYALNSGARFAAVKTQLTSLGRRTGSSSGWRVDNSRLFTVYHRTSRT